MTTDDIQAHLQGLAATLQASGAETLDIVMALQEEEARLERVIASPRADVIVLKQFGNKTWGYIRNARHFYSGMEQIARAARRPVDPSIRANLIAVEREIARRMIPGRRPS